MITFSKEKKNSSPKTIKKFQNGDKFNISSLRIFKLVTKYFFVTIVIKKRSQTYGCLW